MTKREEFERLLIVQQHTNQGPRIIQALRLLGEEVFRDEPEPGVTVLEFEHGLKPPAPEVPVREGQVWEHPSKDWIGTLATRRPNGVWETADGNTRVGETFLRRHCTLLSDPEVTVGSRWRLIPFGYVAEVVHIRRVDGCVTLEVECPPDRSSRSMQTTVAGLLTQWRKVEEERPQPKTCKCGENVFRNAFWYSRQGDRCPEAFCRKCLCLLLLHGNTEQLYREGEELGEAMLGFNELGNLQTYTLDVNRDLSRAGTCVRVRLVEVKE